MMNCHRGAVGDQLDCQSGRRADHVLAALVWAHIPPAPRMIVKRRAVWGLSHACPEVDLMQGTAPCMRPDVETDRQM